MGSLKSRPVRRAVMILNHASVIGLGVSVCIGEYGVWSTALAAIAIGCAVLAATTFVLVFVRTGFWSLAHAAAEDLDERQLEITHAGFRRSYILLGMVCMALLIVVFVSVRFQVFTLTWRGHYAFGLVALMFMNYMLNTLPASYLAWTEKEVVERG